MSIHPGYAEAILSGRKRAEFRKRPLAEDVRTVLIYATAPVSAIVGWFTVRGTLKAAPEDIWRQLHSVGEICWHDFTNYYSGRQFGSRPARRRGRATYQASTPFRGRPEPGDSTKFQLHLGQYPHSSACSLRDEMLDLLREQLCLAA